MIWVSTIDGEECVMSVQIDGTLNIRCDLLSGKTFDSEEKLEAAIKAYKLSLRKDFSNKTAYTMQRQYSNKPDTISEVEVTSVIGDKEAWIKTNGKRSKVNRTSLYANRAEVQAAVDLEAECKAKISAAWDAVVRWQPEAAR